MTFVDDKLGKLLVKYEAGLVKELEYISKYGSLIKNFEGIVTICDFAAYRDELLSEMWEVVKEEDPKLSSSSQSPSSSTHD